jgi:hypothetical protein
MHVLRTNTVPFAAGLTLAVGLATTAMATATYQAHMRVKAPLVCSRGPSTQSFNAVVTIPSSRPTGSTLKVRIDGVPSGKISHAGLNYIHDMRTDYLVPAGTSYVKGSARLVPSTGTPNVRADARAFRDAGGIHVLLPGHVENGSSYTPPSLEFEVEIGAPAGTFLSLKLDRYELMANVFILGDLQTICDPRPKPYSIGVTRVDAQSSH